MEKKERTNTGVIFKNIKKRDITSNDEVGIVNCTCPKCESNNEYNLLIFHGKKDKNGNEFKTINVKINKQK